MISKEGYLPKKEISLNFYDIEKITVGNRERQLAAFYIN